MKSLILNIVLVNKYQDQIHSYKVLKIKSNIIQIYKMKIIYRVNYKAKIFILKIQMTHFHIINILNQRLIKLNTIINHLKFD
jgi:hypothetical protein